MGQIVSCACENVFLIEGEHAEAIVETKPGKKKHEITKIRNRINSVVNPLKLPKFEELLVAVTTPRTVNNKPNRKTETLKLVSEDPQKEITLKVEANSTGTIRFEVGTEQDIAETYKVHVNEEKEEFRLSVKYFEAVNSEGREEGTFFLKDEAVGLGCFARIRQSERILITNGMLISIGNEFLVPCFLDDLSSSGGQATRKLEVKLYGGYAKGEVIDLDCSEEDCVVNVGRARHCRLVIGDPILSKIQCRLVRKNCKWYLLDGSESDPSTNGTWVYMANPTRVTHDMQIRCGSLYYRCQLLRDGTEMQ